MKNKLKKLTIYELRKLALYLQMFVDPGVTRYKVDAVTDEIRSRLSK